MAKPSEIDWGRIKTEYVTTGISTRDLAKKFGVGVSSVCAHCKKGDWVRLREEHQRRAVSKAVQKSEEKEANRLARLMEATTKAIDVAMEAFEDEQQFNRYIVSDGIGEGASVTEERIYAKIDTKALKDLTGVLKDLTGLMRDFYNIPTPAQAEAQRIAAARLELEQKKASSEQTGENTSLEIAGLPERYKV